MAYAQGIDKTTNTSRVVSYGGYFESAFYNVGTPSGKRRIDKIEFQLVEPLATGQGIQLKYRTSTAASWTLIGTFDFATYGAIQSYSAPLFTSAPDCEFIQIRCELTTGASSNTSPKLRQILIK